MQMGLDRVQGRSHFSATESAQEQDRGHSGGEGKSADEVPCGLLSS